jgi:hypothetical protein
MLDQHLLEHRRESFGHQGEIDRSHSAIQPPTTSSPHADAVVDADPARAIEVDPRLEARSRRARGGRRARAEIGERDLRGRHHELDLAGEVVVDRRPRHLDASGDVVQRAAVEAVVDARGRGESK